MLLTLWTLGQLHAQEPGPPARVTRIDRSDGSARFLGADGSDWPASAPQAMNRPLVPGDRLQLQAGARAELHSGDAALRLQGPAMLQMGTLDDATTQLRLTEGSLIVHVRGLDAGERFEIGTPQLALLAQGAGAWRLDVDPVRGSTRVAALAGNATAWGEGGETQAIPPGRALAFGGRNLAPLPVYAMAPDAFDAWAAERERLQAASPTARWVSRDLPGWQQLDSQGDWQTDVEYGTVWIPRGVAADWAPFRQGRWEWIAPWGRTWVDDAPFGFATSHYGRWARIGPRWGWVPGPRLPRPVFAPALVGMVQGPRGPGWVPLAPGEAWRPFSPQDSRYTDRVNRGVGGDGGRRDGFRHQQQPGAVTLGNTPMEPPVRYGAGNDRDGRDRRDARDGRDGRSDGGRDRARDATPMPKPLAVPAPVGRPPLPGVAADAPARSPRDGMPSPAPVPPAWRGVAPSPDSVPRQRGPEPDWRGQMQREREAERQPPQAPPRTEPERQQREQQQQQQQQQPPRRYHQM